MRSICMIYGRKTVTYGNSGVVYAVMIGYSTYHEACRSKRMRTVHVPSSFRDYHFYNRNLACPSHNPRGEIPNGVHSWSLFLRCRLRRPRQSGQSLR